MVLRRSARLLALLLVTGAACVGCGSSDPGRPVTETVDEALGCVTTEVDWPTPDLFEVVGVTPEEAATPMTGRTQLWTGPSPFQVPPGGQVWLVSLDEDYPLGVTLTVPADPDVPAAELGSVSAWGGRFVLTCPRNKFRSTAATLETQKVAIATLGLPEAEARAVVEDAGLVFNRARIDGAGPNMTADLRWDRINVALVDGEVRQASVF